MTASIAIVKTGDPPKLPLRFQRFKIDPIALAPQISTNPDIKYDVRSIKVNREDMIAVLDLIGAFLTSRGFTAKPREIFHEDEATHVYGRDYYSMEGKIVSVWFGAQSGDTHATIAIKASNPLLTELKEHFEMPSN